jgi:lipopolysaccharide export system protein LptA
MSNKVFSLCLISVISLGLVTSGSAAEEKKAAAAAKVHTLALPGMELKGEEIDYNVQRDGKHDISLRGQSALKIDEIVITANFIHVTYSKIENAVLDLKGNVTIFSKGDKLRANAVEAKFDFGAKSLTLKGEAEQDALLIRYTGSKTTRMEAAEIEIQFKDQNVVSIKSQGPVAISERNATKEDQLFSPQSSPGDLFGVPQSPRTGFESPPFSSPGNNIFSPSSK